VSSEVLAAPVVVDGMAVVRSGDSRIYAFEAADGKRRWVYQRSTPTLSLRSAVSVLVDGRVTLAGFPGGKLVAIATITAQPCGSYRSYAQNAWVGKCLDITSNRW
jgi:outer membrane protein assembly factor BamB